MIAPLTEQIDYQQEQLHIESRSIESLAEHMDSPFYCYSQARLLENVQRCKAAFEPRGIRIHYAMKANSNLHILGLIAEQGLGVDLVSGGEMQRALTAGFSAESMIFSGVGKTVTELNNAIKVGVGQFNVESAEELELLAVLATEQAQAVNVTLRANPDVAVDTHRNITTGQKGNKFGIAMERVLELCQQYLGHPFINIDGLAMHIGSQICDVNPYRNAIAKLMALVAELRAEEIIISSLDLGGGFGINYGATDAPKALSFESIAQVIETETAGFDGSIIVEPGRSIVADTGILVSRVTYVKEAEPRPFLILEAAMNDLMRPALYQAVHPMLTVRQEQDVSIENDDGLRSYDIVGPICESTDTFARDYPLSRSVKAGDFVVFLYAGAYSSVMTSSYNSRDIVPEVMVNGTEARIIRKKVDQQTLMSFEQGELVSL